VAFKRVRRVKPSRCASRARSVRDAFDEAVRSLEAVVDPRAPAPDRAVLASAPALPREALTSCAASCVGDEFALRASSEREPAALAEVALGR